MVRLPILKSQGFVVESKSDEPFVLTLQARAVLFVNRLGIYTLLIDGSHALAPQTRHMRAPKGRSGPITTAQR